MADVRRCVIDDEGGPVTVRLLVHNALRAGAEFRIKPDSGDELARWEMRAGDTGEDEHEVGVPVADLDRTTMNWEILVCTVKDTIRSGLVEVQVLQDGVTRPMTKPAQWQLERVPSCETNKVKPIRARLGFIAD